MSVVASADESDVFDQSGETQRDKTQNIQFIDEMLENKTEDKVSNIDTAENRGIPGYVKYGIPLFAMTLLLGVVSLYWVFSSNEKESGEVVDVKPEANTYLSEPHIIEQDSDFIPASANEPSDNVVISHLSGIDTLADANGNTANDRFSPIEKNIDAIEKKVELLIREVGLSDSKLESLKKSISQNDDLELLVSQVASISERISSLEGRFTSEIKNVNRYRQYKREVPPFSLVSIDQWGGSYSARVLHSGREIVMEQGDVLHGWLIKDFIGYKELNVCSTRVDKCLGMKVH
jgi:hypothetical protein